MIKDKKPQQKRLTYDNNNRPRIGSYITVIKGDNLRANQFEGKKGKVGAYSSGFGVYALFQGESGYIIIPFEQCQ